MKKKHTLVSLLLTMMFSLISFTSLAQPPQGDCPPDDPDAGQFWHYGGTVLVDHILCADVYVEFCYAAYTGDFQGMYDFYVTNIYFVPTETPCDLSEVQEIFDIGYWSLWEDYIKTLVMVAIHNQGNQIPFCDQTGLATNNVVTLSLASCDSKDFVLLYSLPTVNPDGTTTIKDYYGRKKCAQESYCESQYQICWKWYPEFNELRAFSSLVSRKLDVFDQCPESIRYYLNNDITQPVRVECVIRCDEQ